MARSTEPPSWPLNVWVDLAPLMHIIEDLKIEKDILHLCQPIVVLYGCFHLSDSCEARHI